MSTLANISSNVFFSTEANLPTNQEYGSLIMKKNVKQDIRNTLNYSSVLYKSKFNSKQKLISPQLQSIINKIQVFVDDVDNKIQNRVQLVKQVYLNEYKDQVLEMTTQLKNLRQKLDNQIMKQRANQKLFYLQEERDFFRSQVLKLNEEMNNLNQQNKVLKRQIEQEKRESQNYKKIVYNLQQKLLKLKNANIQRQKMLQAESTNTNTLKTKNHSSTVDLKHLSGPRTQRYPQRSPNNLQTIENQDQKEFNKTTYKLKTSHSYQKFSTPQRQFMRSTAVISYPKKTIQKLQKIQGYSQLLERQQIIDQCINQMKKQIYYRNLSIGEKQSKVHFNQSSQIKFQQFTKTDKKQLIIKLLSHQKILNQFYEFLFMVNKAKNQSKLIETINNGATVDLIRNKLEKLDLGNSNEALLRANKTINTSKFKITDAKFNTQMLSSMKTEFNKKIFDIKHNR